MPNPAPESCLDVLKSTKKQLKLLLKRLILLIYIVLLSSCYSTKRLIRKNSFVTSEFDHHKLNGIYDNSTNDSTPQNLWTVLKSSYTDRVVTINLDSNKVKLTLVDNKKLNVQLLDKSDKYVIEEFSLDGKIKDDFFTIDRKLTLYPFVPIYYVNKETKTIIGNDFNGNLVLVSGSVNEAMILMVAGGYRNIRNIKFKRIGTKNNTTHN